MNEYGTEHLRQRSQETLRLASKSKSDDNMEALLNVSEPRNERRRKQPRDIKVKESVRRATSYREPEQEMTQASVAKQRFCWVEREESWTSAEVPSKVAGLCIDKAPSRRKTIGSHQPR